MPCCEEHEQEYLVYLKEQAEKKKENHDGSA